MQVLAHVKHFRIDYRSTHEVHSIHHSEFCHNKKPQLIMSVTLKT